MKFTLAMPYYINEGILRLHLETWASYPKELRDRMRFILVDDASPSGPAEPVIRANPIDAEVWLFRIHEDVPWRWDGARNLAMDQAPDGPCLITDVDHVLDAANAARLVAMTVRDDFHYVPARRKADGTRYKRHPNSWILQRSLYWKAGGYDERFSAYYGKDRIFRDRLNMVSRRREIDDVVLTLYGREVIPDASTHTLGRKESEYYSANYPEVRALMGKAHLQKPELTLNFTWSRVL